jgi:type I restriction enzyme S subunit
MKQGWEIKRLDYACEVEYGTRVVNKRDGGKTYPVYGGGGATFFMDTYNRENCFVVARFAMSEKCTRFVEGKFFLNDSGLSVRPKNSKEILQDFLNLQMLFLNDHIYSLARGTAQKNLDVPAFRNIEINYPKSLPEQQRIVAILDEAFAAIAKAKANAEQNLKNAKELFESYLQGVFDNGNWEEKRLEEICILISKGSSPKWQGIKYVDEPGVLFVTSENVGENTLLLEKRKFVEEKFNISDKKSILKNGDVLTNIVGASIGRTAIFDLDDIANINQAVCLIRCNQKFLFNEYLMYLLNSPFTKQHLHDNEVNNARANLSLGFFRSLLIPLPEFSEQRKVVDKIKAFHIETQKLESIYQSKINDMEELKKSILQKAFSGELKIAKALV